MMRGGMGVMLLLAVCACTAFAQGGPELDLSTIQSLDAIPAGSESRVVLSVTLPEGWHVNSNQPLEDFLIKTELKFEDTDALQATQIVYADPELMKFGFSPEPMSVYEGEFFIGYTVHASENAAPGEHELTGTLRYQACDDTSCYAPKTVPISATFKVADASYTPTEVNALRMVSSSFPMAKEAVDSAPIVFGNADDDDRVTGEVMPEFDGVKPGATLRLALRMSIVDGFHTNAHEPLEKNLKPTVWTIEAPDGITVLETVHPEAETKKFSFSETPMAVYEGTIDIGALIDVGDVEPGAYVLNASLKYQACDDELCYGPVTETFEIPVRILSDTEAPVRLTSADVFDAIPFNGEGTVAPTETSDEVGAVVDQGDWQELLPGFTVLAQASGKMSVEEFTAFIDGAESGEGFSQGSFLEGRSIWFVILAAIVGGLLLNLTPCVLPVIPINLAIIGAGVQGMKEGSTRSRGFALGGVYGLGIALVFGGLGLIVVLGLGTFGTINANWWFSIGIAVLFIVMALAMFDIIVIDFSKFQTKLGIQQSKGSFAFAFIMGAVSALLAGACVAPVLIAVLLYSQDLYAKGSVIGLVLPFMLGLGMALPWPFAGGGMSFLPKPGMWMVRLKQAMGVFILGFALYYGWIGWGQFSNVYLVDEEAVIASAEQFDERGWTKVLGNGLAQAKAEDKLVLVDFWASWCKNCLWMDHNTLADPAIESRIEDYVKIKYQAEVPDESPHKDVLAYFDKYVGLPHYAILKSN